MTTSKPPFTGPVGAVVSSFGAVVRPIQAFFRLEAASGILLFVGAVAALWWANSGSADSYRSFVEAPFLLSLSGWELRFNLDHLVNDVLMAIFFFVVGMEIKRELVSGELRTVRRAMLPAIAAVGGMLVPSAIFLIFNFGQPGQAGWGVPMATDIAFAVGCLTILGRRVPQA